jgi:mannose-6-phosphate isomerase
MKENKENLPIFVKKPWGAEVWLELNDHYCYKRIYLNVGTRTSLQYHTKKIETNYIIEGSAEVWLENERGEIDVKKLDANDYFNVLPPKKHRVIALTNLILQEVSTPEVDDVIRVEDDSGRSSGRVEGERSD